MNQPLFPGIGVVVLVQEPWNNEHWQDRHQIVSRLSSYFKAIWMDPSEDWPISSDNWTKHVTTFIAPHDFPDMLVYHPERWLPRFYRPQWLSSVPLRLRLLRARRALRRRGCRRLILYVWNPAFARALETGPYDLTSYHIDDEYSFSSQEVPISEPELMLLRNVDQVFIHSPALMEKKGKINPHTALVPNGVDYRLFASPAPEPTDLARIAHPRIGYAGYLKKQLDWPLILALTARHPDWSFVFVGARVGHPELEAYLQELSTRSNVHILGAKPTPVLAQYPQHFDVCLMPYAKNDYTKYIYPLKLHEYLATGRPVVGTRLPAVEPFAQWVALPGSQDEWSAAIADSLKPSANSNACRASRQAIAREHDWDRLVLKIAQTMLASMPDLSPAERSDCLERLGGIASKAEFER